MTLVPLDATPEAWLWFECPSGSTLVLVDGSEIRGSWVPYTRVLSFNAMAAHMIQSPVPMTSVVMYRTARMPVRRLLMQLAELGFPLDIEELTTMANEPEGYTTDEIERSVEDEEQIEPTDEHAADSHLPDGQEIVLGNISDTPWTGGKRTVVYKVQRDGSFKRLHAEMPEGSTVLQLRQALKRHLKLNILKVFLTLWQGGDDMPDLDDVEAISSERLYHVRIRNLPGGALPGQPRAIGAPRGTRPAPHSTAEGERGGRPGSSVSALAACEAPDESIAQGRKRANAPTPCLQAPQPQPGDGTLEARVSALEAKQAEILRILQSTQEAMLHQLRGAQQTQQPIRPLQPRPVRPAKGASKSSSSYGQPSWRQGGGRFHRVQQEAVSQSAASLVHTDLEARPCNISGELISHLLSTDRKCALACFQAKTKAQRLRALAAGLGRMGLTEQSRQVLVLAGGSTPRADGIGGMAGSAASSNANPSTQRGPTGGHSARHSKSLDPSMAEIISPLDLLEMWAHSQDAANTAADVQDPQDPTLRSSSLTQIHEMLTQLIDRRVQDSIADSAINMAQVIHHLTDRLNRMEASRPDFGTPQPPLPVAPDVDLSPTPNLPAEPSTQHLCSRLYSLEKEMAGWASLLESWKTDANSHFRSMATRIDHVDRLMAMQTQAIRQSWAWMLAVVQTVQQQTLFSQEEEERPQADVGTMRTPAEHLEARRVDLETPTLGEPIFPTLVLGEAEIPEEVAAPPAERDMEVPAALIRDEEVLPEDTGAGLLGMLYEPLPVAPVVEASENSEDDADQAACEGGQGVVTLSDTE
eukprot:6108942-Amphidinium_carterae.1